MASDSGHSRWFRKDQGFTLLEVLMAMAILAIAGMTVLRTTSESLDNSQYLKNKTLARWVADNELVDLYLQQFSSTEWPPQTWQKATRELAGQTWHVRYRSLRTGNEGFRAIQVEVRLDRDEKKAALASLQTYRVKTS